MNDRRKPKSTRKKATPRHEPSEAEIRDRAYRRYLQRGGGHGRDLEDWYAAEEELRGPAQP